MRIVRRIFGNWDQDEIAVLQAHGIDVAPGCNAFTLDEQDERYAQQAMRGRLEREGVKMTYVPITTDP